jgi:hypothetical protein
MQEWCGELRFKLQNKFGGVALAGMRGTGSSNDCYSCTFAIFCAVVHGKEKETSAY